MLGNWHVRCGAGEKVSVKGKLGILISACVVVASVLFWYVQKELYSTETVMESLKEVLGNIRVDIINRVE